jgi:copper chaperone CopZ
LSDELSIPATNVHISLISQTITVRHTESITPHAIAHALEKVGFEVEDDEQHAQGSTSWFPKPLAGMKRKRRHREVCKSCQAEDRANKEKKTLLPKISFSKSISAKSSTTDKTAVPDVPARMSTLMQTEFAITGMTCSSCSNAIAQGVKANRDRGILSCDVNVMTNSARVVHDSSRFTAQDVANLIEELGYHAEVVQSLPMARRSRITSQDQTPTYRLEFHIGGMTCASCSNSVTRGLQEEPYIKSVNVNLMANSGTVILNNRDDAQKVKEAVEAMGFICDLGEFAPLRPLEASPANDIRLVRIRIDGMFCRYSPSLNLINPVNVPIKSSMQCNPSPASSTLLPYLSMILSSSSAINHLPRK